LRFSPNSAGLSFTLNGLYKIQYGVVCEQTEGGRMDIIKNGVSIPGSLITPLTSSGSTNAFLTLEARSGDEISLRTGGGVALSKAGVNAFLMIESVN
jgi:hypothetical protein